MKILCVGLMVTILLQACTTTLTPKASTVRIVENKTEHECRFISTLSAFDTFGANTGKESENALNELRTGDVSLAMDTLEIYPYVLRDRKITEYIDNPIGFHAEMNVLADDLQKEGL